AQLFSLPLLRRVRSLSMADLRGLGRLSRAPPGLPPNIKRLMLGLDSEQALDAAVTLGLLEQLEELEVMARRLSPDAPGLLLPPAAQRLERLVFSGLPPRSYHHFDQSWFPELKRLLGERPALQLGWRGIDYDASNVDRLPIDLDTELQEEPLARP